METKLEKKDFDFEKEYAEFEEKTLRKAIGRIKGVEKKSLWEDDEMLGCLTVNARKAIARKYDVITRKAQVRAGSGMLIYPTEENKEKVLEKLRESLDKEDFVKGHEEYEKMLLEAYIERLEKFGYLLL